MNLAIIGGGRMGSSLIRGLLSSGLLSGPEILITSSTAEKAAAAAAALGTGHADSNPEAASRSEVIVLSVKPGKALEVTAGMAGKLEGKLLISMVAGIRSDDLASAAGGACRIVRVMPNTAIRLLRGTTAVAPHSSATDADADLAHRLFGAVGKVETVTEPLLDTVTAVSGSGPAFALLMIEAMAAAGVEGGLESAQSTRFAAGALAAAADLVRETGENPSALRDEITSPGGTTAAGLRVLTDGGSDASGLGSLVRKAVAAAAARSRELSAPR